jgi:hypothetical protein
MGRLGACPFVSSAECRPAEEAGHLTHYVIVRADLSRGIQAANLVHAAGESSPGGLPSGTYAVVLAVPDESALKAVAARLKLAAVGHVLVVEPDAPFNGALMAIGLVPGPREVIRRLLSSLPLLR